MELPDDTTINHLINNNMDEAKKGLFVWCDKLLERGGPMAIALANVLTFYLKQHCIICQNLPDSIYIGVGSFNVITGAGPIIEDSRGHYLYVWRSLWERYGSSHLTIRLNLISTLD